MNEMLPVLGFLAVFHLIGGVALGTSVRHWIRRRFACNTLFSAAWGLMFGGLPLVIGLFLFASHQQPILIFAELGIFLGAVLITAAIPDWYLESLNIPTMVPIAFGGLFLLVGIVAGIAAARDGDPLTAIILFAVFVGSGGYVFVSGMNTLLKG